jgi:uncharacterized protein (TIGR02145 family)
MYEIVINIVAGEAPFMGMLFQGATLISTHNFFTTGIHSVPVDNPGEYELLIIDSLNCEELIEYIIIDATTSTSTSTSSTTEEPTTTTTTSSSTTTTTTTTTEEVTTTTTTNEPIIAPECIERGLLYNGYNLTGISSSDDWIVPSGTEVQTLVDYLGGLSVAGGKLKETGYTYWNFANTGATNEVGFNGRSGGVRMTSGGFAGIGTNAEFMVMSTGYGKVVLTSNSAAISYQTSGVDRRYGRTIRLVRTSTLLNHGETGVYVGNDGTIYATICIGTQEWMSENLAETQKRDNSPILYIADDTDWGTAAIASVGALCAYNNDFAYVGCDIVITTTTTTTIEPTTSTTTTSTTTEPGTTTTTTTCDPQFEFTLLSQEDTLDYAGMEFVGLTQDEIDGLSLVTDDGGIGTWSFDFGQYLRIEDYTFDVQGSNEIRFSCCIDVYAKVIGLEFSMIEIGQASLDISMFPNLQYAYFYDGAGLTIVDSITLPATTNGIDFQILDFPLLESLVIPAWTASYNNRITLYDVGAMNSVTFGLNTNLRLFSISNLYSGNTVLTSLDFTNVIPFKSGSNYPYFGAKYCTALTTVTLPTNLYLGFNVEFQYTAVVTLNFAPIIASPNLEYVFVNLDDNAMTAAQVNKILYDLDAAITSCSGTKYISIGGTNATPDSSSGGFDGCAAKASLEAKGFTVLITGTCPTTTTTTTTP